jgi:hypothetical protein
MRVAARSLLWVACGLLLALGVGGSAHAVPVSILMTGTWTVVTDSAGVTDGSIVAGGAFSVAILYDDSAPDLDPDPLTGGYIFPAATSDFTITTGNYTFLAGSALTLGIENNNNGDDVLGFYADQYSIVGPLPGGASVATPAYANPVFFDATETALSSDRLTDLQWDLSSYQIRSQDFVLFVAINDGSGPLEYIELLGRPLTATVLPEPVVPALLIFAAIALRARSAMPR